MKRVWARIGMSLMVSDEEAEQLLKEAGCNDSGQNYEYDINEAFAQRLVKYGKVDGDCYIPENCIFEDGR